MKIADEVFIATALLEEEHPNRTDFSINEIVERVIRQNLSGELRPGVRVHVSTHCVANRPPNPAGYRMLYATAEGNRRLLRSGDDVHPARKGKMFPDKRDVPAEYHDLIERAKRRYGDGTPSPTRWLDGVFNLAGMGRHLWKGEDPDKYVESLRENWR